VRFQLAAGRTIDVLTQTELKAGLTEQTASWFQEMARGLNTARFDAVSTVATGAVTLPGPGVRSLGPDVGFAWAVQRITADGLADQGVLVVYRNSAQPVNRLGTITSSSPFHAGSKGALLRGDERLIITGASLTATGDIAVNGEAIEVAESDIYKII
jgi:hypothetical protein